MLLVATDTRFEEHDAGRGHPERPDRVRAVLDGLDAGAPRDARRRLDPRRATRDELERVHTVDYLDHLERFCMEGGGRLDADTGASAASWEAALLAAGSGLEAVDALERGDGDSAFCAVRPPGHHAVAARAMGFCLLNNVAVTAAALRDRGERVLVVDWDAHHGNGTQDIFYGDGSVMYVSMHEWPLYPGTGRLTDAGTGAGAGATVNFPLPAGATGDVYLDAIDTVVEPLAERFAPTWVLVSAGIRRPSGRSADGPRPFGRRLRRSDRPDHGARTAPAARGVPRGRLRPRGAARFDRGHRLHPARPAGSGRTRDGRRSGAHGGPRGPGSSRRRTRLNAGPTV